MDEELREVKRELYKEIEGAPDTDAGAYLFYYAPAIVIWIVSTIMVWNMDD